MARGLLTRPRAENSTIRAQSDTIAQRFYAEPDLAVVDAVQALAQEKGLPAAQVALAWMLHKPAVTAPIVGATKPGHIEDAVAAVDVELTDDQIAALEKPYVPHPVIGH